MTARIRFYAAKPDIAAGISRDLTEYVLPSFFRRSMDTMTGNFQIALIPGAESAIPDVRSLVGGVIQASVDKRIIFTGFIETRKHLLRSDAETLTFSGRGLLADTIDSNPPVNHQIDEIGKDNFRNVVNQLLRANGFQGIQADGGDTIKMAVSDFVVDPERSIERNIRAAAKGIIGVHLFESADGNYLTLWDKTLASDTEEEIRPERGVEISTSTDTSRLFYSYLQVYDFANATADPVIVDTPENSLYLPDTIRQERKWVREYTGKDRDGLSERDAGEQTDFVRRDSIREGLKRLAAAETAEVILPGISHPYEIGQIIAIALPGLKPKRMMISETEHRIADKMPGHALKLKLSHIPAWDSA